jgi:hypothetical protein
MYSPFMPMVRPGRVCVLLVLRRFRHFHRPVEADVDETGVPQCEYHQRNHQASEEDHVGTRVVLCTSSVMTEQCSGADDEHHGRYGNDDGDGRVYVMNHHAPSFQFYI